jgi:hypothetical protein
MRDVATRETVTSGRRNGAAARATARDARPYPPSWLHLLVASIDRLPGPAWAWYVAAGVAQSLVFHLQPWTLGRAPFGQLDATNIYWGVLLTLLLWVAGSLEGVAASAVDAGRAALRLSDEDVARLRYELAVAPAVPSAVAVVLAAALTLLQFVVDPAGSNIVGLAAPLVAAAFLGQLVNVAILLVLLLQLVRQVRIMRGTLARHAIIDPFRPGPLSAFSRLTARLGIAIVLLTTSGFLIVPATGDIEAFLVTSAPYIVVPPIVAALAFILPVSGLHQRLVDEKERLQDETELRLKAFLEDLNRDVDGRDLQRADAMNKTLDSLLQEREVLSKLPTWPWSMGTLRSLVTAILLPLFLFVVQLLVSRVI